jgi:hypothetical protein
LPAISNGDWSLASDSIQRRLNEIENKLTGIINLIAPIEEFINGSSTKSCMYSDSIKLIKGCKGLLKKLKRKYKQSIKKGIKQIDKSIKGYHHKKKSHKVKRAIIPENSGSI